MADLATRLRTPVPRDRYKQAILYIPEAEGPARFAKALLRVGKALAAIHDKDCIANHELAILSKITLDAIPSRRRKVLEALTVIGKGSSKEIGMKADIATTSTGVILEDLMYLKAVDRRVDSNSENATFFWRLRPGIESQWRVITKIAQSKEVHRQKQPRDMRDIYKEEVPSLVFAGEPPETTDGKDECPF